MDLFVTGSSWKDFSTQDPNRPKVNIALASWSPGGSAQTLQGWLLYLNRHSVEIIIWENVEGVDQQCQDKSSGATQSALDIIRACVSAQSYKSLKILAGYALFGVPQEKKTVLFVRPKGDGVIYS